LEFEMEYNKPFDQDDPNAPYVDGNPATGTEGSIPSARSIEHDQREVVEVINWAYNHGFTDQDNNPCLAPTWMDLTQLRKAIYGICKSLIPPPVSNFLINDTDRYVDGTIGSDTLYDGYSATITAGHGPFKTMQRALMALYAVNLNGHTFNIHVANGTYNFDQRLDMLAPNGSGAVAIIGNEVTPSSVTFNSLAGSCVAASGGLYYLRGLKFIANGAIIPGDVTAGVWCAGASTVFTINCEYGNCKGPHVSVGSVYAPHSAQIITGNAPWHIYVTGNSVFSQPNLPDYNIPGAVAFSSAFIQVESGGSHVGTYNSLTGAANVTGKRYYVRLNGTINTGTSNANYFPGTIAGTTDTGGQYI